MSASLPRRRLLSGGAALAATAVIAAPSVSRALRAHQADEAGGPSAPTVVVRWNAKAHKWAARPATADFGVMFLSTNDPSATAPTDSKVQPGDIWRRHPDAVEA